MNKIIIHILIAMILISSVFALDAMLETEEEEEAYKEAYEKADMGWYNVADWEREVCGNIYAGERTSSSGEPSRITSLEYYTNDIIVEINAKKSEPTIFNQTMIGSFYEVSWFIQPMTVQVSYNIEIFDFESNVEPVDSGFTTLERSAYPGYKAYFMEEGKGYKSATIEIPEADLKMTVPFIGADNATVEDIFEISGVEPYEERDYCNEPGCQLRTRYVEEEE